MNQKNIDDNFYLSEDKVKCKKGRTEAYFVNKKNLILYGPKFFKFGDYKKGYYFQSKINANKFIDKIIKRKMKYRLNKLIKHDTPNKTKKV